MIYFNKIKNFIYLKFYIQFIIYRIVKRNIKTIRYFKLNSYNGRNVSFTFIDKKTKKKYFIKYYFNYKYLDHEIKIIELFKTLKLIDYSIYYTDNKNYFIRNFVSGITIDNTKINSDILKSQFTSKIIDYIENIIQELFKYNKNLHLDLRISNFLLTHNNNFNIIDTDLSHQNHTLFKNNINKKNYFNHTIAKFFTKSIESIGNNNINYFFRELDKNINNFDDIKLIILQRFYHSYENRILDRFIYENFEAFKGLNSYFDKNVKVKDKIISTLSNLNNNKYIIARRYKWLLANDQFDSKDIDILCDENEFDILIDTFSQHGWDIYNNKISQYFANIKKIVQVDIKTFKQTGIDKQFLNILSNHQKFKGIKIIDEESYLKLIIKNSFQKKYLKESYLLELKNYILNKDSFISDKYSYLLESKKFYYNKKYYYNLEDKFLRKIKDFIKNKKIILLGADGAGKSTSVDLIYKYLKVFVKVEKKYFGNFFLPSGRTNLLIIPTSFIFAFLKKIKDIFFKTNFNIGYNKYTKNGLIENDTKLLMLKSKTYQIFTFLFIPFFIIDILCHKFIVRMTFARFTICDRYYDDILLNYNLKLIRKFLSIFFLSKKNKILFFADSKTHFNRKNQESIKMIEYMHKVYLCQRNDLEICTDLPINVVNKKLLNFIKNKVVLS